MGLGFAPCPSPCRRVPRSAKGENCDNTRKTEWHQSGHLGTTDGTVFRAFSGSTGWRNRCMVGSSRGRWLTCALVNYPWPRRRLWAACTRGCSASRDPFWWLCDLRAGTVDVPFDKTRKPGSGAWLGYPPRSTRTELSDPRPPVRASYRCIAGHRSDCRRRATSRSIVALGACREGVTADGVLRTHELWVRERKPHAKRRIMAHAIKTPVASTDAPVQLTRVIRLFLDISGWSNSAYYIESVGRCIRCKKVGNCPFGPLRP
jgi:hypothetical protein